MSRGINLTRAAGSGLALMLTTACAGATPSPASPPGRTASAPTPGPTTAAEPPVAASAPCHSLTVPLTPPPDAQLQPQADGVWVLTRGARFVGAIRVRPTTARLRVEPQGLCSSEPGSRVLATTTRLVSATRWVNRAGVRSLQVTPTWAARSWPESADAIVVELSPHHPELSAPGMRDQLRCHVTFAARKQAWNLEPARPDVGYAATVAERCNPGGIVDVDGR